MFKLTPTAKVVLGLLKLGARTGYDVKRFADVSTRFFWGASYGQIYPELRRLASAGLIRAKEQPRGGVSRTEYTLTARGERALHDWLTEDPEALTFEYRDEPLLKLFLGDVLTRDEIGANLRGAREQFERVIDRFREIEQLAAADEEEGAPRYPGVALQYGIELMEWIVAWYRETERRLEEGELPEPQLSS
jgi:DNA-binding PadR family transcriptional regulator